MQSILEEFAYGNISPQPQCVSRDSEHGKALRLVSVIEEKLLAELNDDGKELLEKFIIAQNELISLTAVKNFLNGYRLGVTMTAEAFVTSGEF